MTEKTIFRFPTLYACLLALELACVGFPSLGSWHYWTKPALVLSLIIYVVVHHQLFDHRGWLLAALGCSWTGDILLMFVPQAPLFFMLGLLAFLTAHVFYCLLFLKERAKPRPPIGLTGILLIYALGILLLIKNQVGPLLIPIVVYMMVILAMALTAYMRKGKVDHRRFSMVFLGAVLFLVSDSILALNKFYAPIALDGASIMSTYGLAQFFIIMGLKKAP